jgi:hypothetical protein
MSASIPAVYLWNGRGLQSKHWDGAFPHIPTIAETPTMEVTKQKRPRKRNGNTADHQAVQQEILDAAFSITWS